jgi:hypothetical protein
VGDAVASPHNNQGIWATDPFGTLTLVARRSTTVLPFTDDLSNPNNVSGQFHPMRVNGFNDQGQLLFTTAAPNGIATASFIADLGSARVEDGLQLVLDNGESIHVPGKVVVGDSTGSGTGSGLTVAANTTVVSTLGVDIFANGSAVFSGEVVAPRVDVLGSLTIDGMLTGDVYLGEGGLLSGSGSVVGTVFAADGSILSFGNSPGEFNAENFSFADGIVDFRFEIADASGGNGAAGINWDFLNVSDTLTFGDDATISISIVSSDFDSPFAVANWDGSQQYQWLFMRAGNIVGFDTSKFVFSTQSLVAFDGLNSLNQGAFSVFREGNDIFLRFTPFSTQPVPEPSAVVLFALGAMGVGGLRRRRFSLLTRQRKQD